MRNPNDRPNIYDSDDGRDQEKNEEQETTSLLSFPLRLVRTEDDTATMDNTAKSHDVAEYIAEMLQPLESLAQQNRLDVLGLMIAMAREQANDDIRERDRCR
ncbi:MAG: hypothetical protein JJ908_04745 [Rhizobiales bacterium]|nr:hypothetical protein [Hyphomicrobiales bacterium]MBO6735656.1 hypothetical protein [Hyphomicrobiales bacterium]